MSTRASMPLLFTPSQAARLLPETTMFIDASWVMPNSPRKPKEEFAAYRIPKANFLDLDEVASHTDEGAKLGLKHMMPEPEVFARACEKLGIREDLHVILYDSHGCFSAPRALFMFRAFSHKYSSVLNGGLPRWLHEGYPVETGPPNPAAIDQNYKAKSAAESLMARQVQAKLPYPVPPLDKNVIRSQAYHQMVKNSTLPRSDEIADLVLDARSRGRYLGTDPEPRPNLSSGHIPGSFSLPFNHFLENHKPSVGSSQHSLPPYLSGEYATLRGPDSLSEGLRKAVGADFAEQILNGQRSVVTTCGSGMTAAILWLGISSIWEAEQRQFNTLGLYDESWTGYAARPDSRIAKGDE